MSDRFSDSPNEDISCPAIVLQNLKTLNFPTAVNFRRTSLDCFRSKLKDSEKSLRTTELLSQESHVSFPVEELSETELIIICLRAGETPNR